jgi:hypothetical protein
MHNFHICDVGATFIVARALGRHVFGLEGEQTLYVAHLFALQQNVVNVVHFLVTPSISRPPLHSLEPPTPKVACKLGLNLNRPSS